MSIFINVADTLPLGKAWNLIPYFNQATNILGVVILFYKQKGRLNEVK